MLVPSPAFRSMALGIMLSVGFILAATLTLLPAVLAWLGARVDRLALPWVHSGEHRSPRFAGWGERLWRRPPLYGVARARDPRRCSPLPVLRPEDRACRRSRSSRRATARASATHRCRRPSAPARRERCRSSRRPPTRPACRPCSTPSRGSPPSRRCSARATARSCSAVPSADPSDPEVGATIDRLRAALPAGALVGGAAAENHDLESALAAKTPAGLPRRPRPRLPAPPRRAAGAADRAGGRADEPPRDGCGVRRRRARSSRTATCRGCSGSSRRGS